MALSLDPFETNSTESQVFGQISAELRKKRYLERISEVERLIQQKNIEFIRFEQTDIHGVARSKTILSKHFRDRCMKGQNFWSHLCQDPVSNLVSGTGYLEEINYGDFVTYPDLSTFQILPWSENTARVIIEPMLEDGSPVKAHPRWLARQQLHRLENLGYRFYSTVEFEFYLVDGHRKTLDQDINIRATLKNNRVPKLIHQMLRQLPMAGVDIECFESEFGPGQFEMSYKPSYGIDAIDNAFTFKTGVKEIAQQNGYMASFMSKPFLDKSGSAAHFNHSLWDVTGEKNALFDPNRPNKLSEVGEHWLAGIIAHAKSVACLMSPTVNCWHRIVKNSFAPYNVSWGFDNRTTYLRAKTRGESGTYFENRIASGSSNPYLSLAATVAAGIDGIEKSLPLPPDIKGSAYDLPADVCPSLPKDLGEALDALNSDKVMVEALGEKFIKCFTALKKYEIKLCQENSGVTKDWERNYYFEYL